MSVPNRAAEGVTSIEVVTADLFVLAEQYLGDATQWDRIADLNAQDGVQPDYLISAPTPTVLQIPAAITSRPSPDLTVEQLLFGRDT